MLFQAPSLANQNGGVIIILASSQAPQLTANKVMGRLFKKNAGLLFSVI
jgi:hypothetical protein